MKKIRDLFCSLLLCYIFVGISIGTNVITCKVMGLPRTWDSILFSLIFSAVWLFFYYIIRKNK